MGQNITFIKKTALSFVNLLISPGCPVCGKITRPGENICSSCMRDITYSPALMKTFLPHVKTVWSALPYYGTICQCLHKFKYQGNKKVLPVFERIISGSGLKSMVENRDINVIIPVPLSRNRHRNRGFNQSAMLSDLLSALLSVCVNRNCLEKVKDTKPQTRLNKQNRKNNIKKDIFKVNSHSKIKGKTILLVDDVLTTGTTLDRCAEKLLESGAKAVYGFTMAKTV